MKTLIVSGGTPPSPELLDQVIEEGVDEIIAADSGAAVLLDRGIPFDLALGDFDSLDEARLDRLRRDHPVITYEVRKDFTDTEAAYREAVRRGATDIVLLGATGTRLDHVLGNLALLRIARADGIGLVLRDDHNEVFLLSGSAAIKARPGWNLSVFPLDGDVDDFSLRQVAYPLEHHHLRAASTLTVSNEFLEGPAQIDFPKGLVLVILSRD